jgi:uncharacterized membrane protein YeaQ/YmgE (transglycosylase-associated protein family)
MRLLLLLVLAAVIGSVGAAIAGQKRQGCLINIVIGFVGAVIGTWLAAQLHAPVFLVLFGVPVIWAVIGAALFMAVIGAIAGRR